MSVLAAEVTQQWVSEAGPRQTKQVDEALKALAWVGKATRHITDHWSNVSYNLFGNVAEACVEAMKAIGDKWNWKITRANFKDIIADAQQATDDYVIPESDERTTAEERQERAQQAEEANRKRAEHDNAVNASLAAIIAKWPVGMNAIVVAKLHENDSDIMTDYHNHTTKRYVAIGWRRGAREDFRQLREAAAKFEPTAHLAPGCNVWTLYTWTKDDQAYQHRERLPLRGDTFSNETFLTRDQADRVAQERIAAGDSWGYYAKLYGYEAHEESVEHRENYSMGGGNYLKAGHRDSSGWCVVSVDRAYFARYGHVVEDQIPTKAVQPATEPAQTITTTAKAEVQKHWHSKHEEHFWLVVLKDRVDREEFERIRDDCKRAGGWYSRKWSDVPGGFAFDDEAGAVEFAASL